MWPFLQEVIHKTLSGLGAGLSKAGPGLVAMLLVLLLGLLAAGALRLALRLALPRVGADRFAQRLGLSELLHKSGIEAPASRVVAGVVAWLVLAAFVLLAIGILNLQVARDLMTTAFAGLPHLLVAATVLWLGSLIAGFLRRSTLIAAVNAGLPAARLLAGGIHSALMVLFVAMALEHLGVGRQVILTSFTIMFGGLVFALSLAFGLAGRDVARQVLDRVARRGEATRSSGLDPL